MRAFTMSFRVLSLASLCWLTLAASAMAQAKPRPMTASKFDPKAEQVEMFEAMQKNLIEVKVVPKDSLGGNVLISNKHTAPLTVKAPQGFVGVQVTAQFGGGGFGGQGGGFGGQGGGFGGQGGGFGGGGGQAVGGGFGGGGGGQFGGGGGIGGQQGGGFFSIPAERTLKLPYTSVCLEHGKNEPSSRMEYTLIPTEQYTKDPVLQQLINLVGSGQLDKGAAQAAAWNVANNLSFQQLGTKVYQEMGKPDAPYFNPLQLQAAQNIIVAARQRAAADEERKQQNPEAVKEEVPVSQPVANPRAK